MKNISHQIEFEEGRRNRAYYDSEGLVTIGVGFCVDPERGETMPDEVIDLWLSIILNQRARALAVSIKCWPDLAEARKAALINMAYQLGVSGLFAFKNMLRSIENGDFEAAAKHGLDSLWAKQTPERAKRVMEQLRTGVSQYG